MFKKFRSEMFEKYTAQKVRKIFDLECFKNVRPEMFRKNSTQYSKNFRPETFEKFLTRNVRIFWTQNVKKISTRNVRIEIFEKNRSKMSENFPTRNIRRIFGPEYSKKFDPNSIPSFALGFRIRGF